MNNKPGSKIYTARMVAFLGVMNLISGYGTILLWDYFSIREISFLKWTVYFIFLILFTNLSYGTTVSIFGFWKLIAGGDNYRITKNILSNNQLSLKNVSVAVVMPIYGEEVESVFSRIELMYNSLSREKEKSSFDFYILSDTQNVDKWIKEESAFFELVKRLDAFGKIFYRKRKMNLNKKSGNIADFCRRWGKKYKYMIVLDADSLLTGRCIVQLAQLMEENPSTGIIQTSPQIILAKTFFQRIMQFSNSIHSLIFSVGANFWQLNSSPFWGHNAIIRLKPFMENCGLPSLPKLGAVGGRILSHDTIEAALIRKAGYSVWFAYDLNGSYEESPPGIIDSLKRDQRWCQGNFQHFWFLFAKGLKFTSRIHILLGIFAYFSSLLWLIFLICMVMIYFQDLQFYRLALGPEKWKIFWEYAYFQKALKLQIFSLGILFLPRILSFLYMIITLEYKKYSQNIFSFLMSYILEFLFSVIHAPILMYMHSKFILLTLIGFKIEWKSQNRSVNRLAGFKESFHTFSVLSLLGVIAGTFFYYHVNGLFYWMLPIWGSWVLSPFISYLVSFKDKKEICFLKEKSESKNTEVNFLEKQNKTSERLMANDRSFDVDPLFLIFVDPFYNALHSFLQKTTLNLPQKRLKYGNELMERILINGPVGLNSKELRIILYSSVFINAIYTRFWELTETELHPWWNENFKKYKLSLIT
jgi:membrane glycosyltransferase